jgi:hypothetical protein
VDDEDRVTHYLVDFDELALIQGATREKLIADVVYALGILRGGLRAGKRGLSDKAVAQQIFVGDLARALEQAGLPATRWRKKYDGGGGESLLFRVAREVAEIAGVVLPKDLKVLGQRAAQIKYGAMSPAMEAAQDAEVTERRQRLDKVGKRLDKLKSPKITTRRRRRASP